MNSSANYRAFRPLAFSKKIADHLRQSNKRVVVTGAGGWLGQASLEMLESVWGDEFSQRVMAYGSKDRTIVLRSGREVTIRALQDMTSLQTAPTILLHYAFLTKDRTADLDAGEYEKRNNAIRQIVSEAVSKIGVTDLLVTSSGAVYGLPTRADRSLCVDPIGNPYGTGKILDEQHFLKLSEDLRLRVAIPRIFNLSGAYINKQNNYALASIVNAALAGGPVMLRASKRVIRAYTSILDLLDVSVGWLLKDTVPESIVFDTRSSEPVEVEELARLILKVIGAPDINIERPTIVEAPDDCYLGNGCLFELLADQQGVVLANLESQILDTVEYLMSCYAGIRLRWI